LFTVFRCYSVSFARGHVEEIFFFHLTFQNWGADYVPEERDGAHITTNALTSLKAHQSRTKPSSLKNLSTVVRLKFRGQEPNFHNGFTSSCSFTRAVENWALLPILKTTLSTEILKEINL
jgi:hypothetical protein